MKPIVAIVGRPNVGKSTLFNRLVSGHSAIVQREPGVTRDRIYADADWNGREFLVIDTGGLEAVDQFAALVAEQARAAVDEADLVLLVIDARAGLLPDDDTIAQMLRKAQKPTILVANKVETGEIAHLSQEFYELGLGPPLAVSAAHGLGVGDLLDALVERLPADGPAPATDPDQGPVFAVIGRPNVGKSSLTNSLLGERRVITSELPGTTRDPIQVVLDYDGAAFSLVDTAGLRRPSRVEPGVERFSVMRSLRAISRSDAVWLLVDVGQGVSDQERRIAGYAAESGRGLIIVVTKIDLLDRAAGELSEFQEAVRRALYFVPWAPLVAVSALTGEHLGRLVRTSMAVIAARSQRVEPAELDRLISDAALLRPPGSYRGRPLRLLGAEQLPGLPPAFAVFFDHPGAVGGSYLRYIENRLREAYSFTGAPLKVLARARSGRGAAPPTKSRG